MAAHPYHCSKPELPLLNSWLHQTNHQFITSALPSLIHHHVEQYPRHHHSIHHHHIKSAHAMAILCNSQEPNTTSHLHHRATMLKPEATTNLTAFSNQAVHLHLPFSPPSLLCREAQNHHLQNPQPCLTTVPNTSNPNNPRTSKAQIRQPICPMLEPANNFHSPCLINTTAAIPLLHKAQQAIKESQLCNFTAIHCCAALCPRALPSPSPPSLHTEAAKPP
jgi:hypothetical protein